VNWQESLAPLRNRSFAWFFASRSFDDLSTRMAGVALAFAVLEIRDSATALGQVLAARGIPLVLFLLLGGVIADRLPRTLVLQASNLVAGVTQSILAVLVITRVADLWMVIVLVAVNGAADAFNFPAQASVVPQLVPREQLQPVNALMSLSRSGLTVVAPALSALLVVSAGPGWALAVTAGMWFVAAALLLPVVVPPRPTQDANTTMLHELREGWDLFTSLTWLWVVVVAFGLLNAIYAGAWFTLGPAVAKDTIGEQGWGLVLSAESAGVLAVTIVLLRVRLRRPLLAGMLGCALLSIPIALLGVWPDLMVLMLTAFLAGAGIGVFSLGWSVAMQENIEDRLLSRAYSYDALGSFVAIPVGQLVYGTLGDTFGFRDVLLWSGIVYAVIAVATLTSRSVRTLDRPSAAA
jgi:MFS family permease